MSCSTSFFPPIEWKFVIAGLLDWKVYMVFVIYVCSLCAVYSLALNLPAISVGLGYTGPQAQLITVPVYVLCVLPSLSLSLSLSFLLSITAAYQIPSLLSLSASICVILIALVADKYAVRSPCIIFGLVFSCIGYIILYVS
jgi:hypothetical protein